MTTSLVPFEGIVLTHSNGTNLGSDAQFVKQQQSSKVDISFPGVLILMAKMVGIAGRDAVQLGVCEKTHVNNGSDEVSIYRRDSNIQNPL